MYNEAQATFFHPPGRLVVIGDVHGDVQRFLQCLYATKVFNTHLEWIAEPRDTLVVQLGDQIDSLSRTGSAPEWENLCDVEMLTLADRLDQIARLGGGRVLSLLGNHEIMNVEGEFSYVSPASTEKMPLVRRQRMFQPGGDLAKILAKRNLVLKIGSMVFCHAGILPHHLILVDNHIHMLNEVMRKYLRNKPLTEEELIIFKTAIMDMQGILWTRMYVELSEANGSVFREAIESVLERLSAKRIFIGHNTVMNVTSLLEGKVFLMDAGLSRAYGTDRLQCLDIRQPDTPHESMQLLQIEKK